MTYIKRGSPDFVYLFFVSVSLFLVAACGRPETEVDATSSGAFNPNNLGNYNNGGNGFDFNMGLGNGNTGNGIGSEMDDLFAAVASDALSGNLGPSEGEIIDMTEYNAIRDLLSKFGNAEKNSLKNALLKGIAGCSFFGGSSNFDRTNCFGGSARSCGKHILGKGRDLFKALIRRVSNGHVMGTVGQLSSMLSAEQSFCASIDPNDHKAIQAQVEKKKKECMQGKVRSCIGLLLLLVRGFLAAIFGLLFGMAG